MFNLMHFSLSLRVLKINHGYDDNGGDDDDDDADEEWVRSNVENWKVKVQVNLLSDDEEESLLLLLIL